MANHNCKCGDNCTCDPCNCDKIEESDNIPPVTVIGHKGGFTGGWAHWDLSGHGDNGWQGVPYAYPPKTARPAAFVAGQAEHIGQPRLLFRFRLHQQRGNHGFFTHPRIRHQLFHFPQPSAPLRSCAAPRWRCSITKMRQRRKGRLKLPEQPQPERQAGRIP